MLASNRLFRRFSSFRFFSTQLNLEQTLKIVEKEAVNQPSDFLTNFNQIVNAFHADPSQAYLLKSKPAVEFFHKMGTRIQAFSADEAFKVLATCARVHSIPENIREPLFDVLVDAIPNESELTTDRVFQLFLLISSTGSHSPRVAELVEACSQRLISDFTKSDEDLFKLKLSGQGILAGLVGMSNLGLESDDLLGIIAHGVQKLESTGGKAVVSSLPIAHQVSLLSALADLSSPNVMVHLITSQLSSNPDALAQLRPHQVADVLEATAVLGVDSFSMLTRLTKRIEQEALMWNSFDCLRVLQGLVRHKALEISVKARGCLLKGVAKLSLPAGDAKPVSGDVNAFASKFDAITSLRALSPIIRQLGDALTEPERILLSQIEADVRRCTVPAEGAKHAEEQKTLASVIARVAEIHKAPAIATQVALIDGLVTADVVLAASPEQIEALRTVTMKQLKANMYSYDSADKDIALTLPSFDASEQLLKGLHRPLVLLNKGAVESAHLPSQAEVVAQLIKQAGADVAWVSNEGWADVLEIKESLNAPLAENDPFVAETIGAALLETLAASDLITFDLSGLDK